METHETRGEPARREPEVRVDVHTPPPPPRVEVPARRDWDDHDETVVHGGGFARGTPVRIARGERVHDLPHHVIVAFHNLRYFYDDDGNYYEQQGADYVVVQPPVGVTVAALPPGVETVVAGPTAYYYTDGVFYVAQGGVFAVVTPAGRDRRPRLAGGRDPGRRQRHRLLPDQRPELPAVRPERGDGLHRDTDLNEAVRRSREERGRNNFTA